ncbi:MAG: PorV/PorQ family protein [Bacteroidota bacterium]
MKKLSFLFWVLIPVIAYSQTVRKYSNEFMNIGVDAAAFGMANAVTASSDDVNSVYWNPAGLTDIEDNQFAAMHANYFANIATYNYIAGAMPLDDKSAVGLSMIRFGVDDIMNTTQLIDSQGNIDYNRISLFSAADYAFTLTYARKTNIEGLRFGANAKVIRRVIGQFADAWGFGFDVGVQYKTGNWRFGAMARDITTTYNQWSINEEEYETIRGAVDGQNQEMPETTEVTIPKLQLGAARNFELSSKFDLLAAVNFDMRFTQTNDIISTSKVSATPAIGFQGSYIKMVFLRMGLGNFQEVQQLGGGTAVGFQPNFGVGFNYKGIQIDYAFTDIGDQSVALYSNIFSLKLDWSIFR